MLSKQKWRLLDTAALDASNIMALEKVLLESCAGGNVPNTLHLLEFFPCVLLGYSQSLEEEADEDFCRKNGIEINRRISGGGCIFLDGGTLGWEIVAKKNTPGIPGSLDEMYNKLCGGVVLMLSEFGISATYRPLNDVETGGRKISGTGGTEQDDSFIFHGTVLVDSDAEIMKKALRNPIKKRHQKESQTRTICMRELLGFVPSMEEVKIRLANAFAAILDIEFEEGGLTLEETEALAREVSFFRSEDWIFGRKTLL